MPHTFLTIFWIDYLKILHTISRFYLIFPKIKSCLGEVIAVSNKFKDIVDFGFSHLGSSAVKPRIKPLVDTFLSTSHNLSEVWPTLLLHSIHLRSDLLYFYTQSIISIMNLVSYSFLHPIYLLISESGFIFTFTLNTSFQFWIWFHIYFYTWYIF